ncbi:putative recombination endonuclease VII protein [Rhizobium phage RHph_I1_18]|nr:putative recombination endonuclease VII protein [Rhizobium phage RHph_I1_18]
MGKGHKRYKYLHDQTLRKKYGIGLQQYQQMHANQDGVCWICQCEDSRGYALAVDHDHKTGQVRGLLCGECNKILGKYKDEIALFERAIEYLTKDHIVPLDIPIPKIKEEDKPRWRKIFTTPDGVFLSAIEAATFYNVSESTVSHWCGAYRYTKESNIKDGFSVKRDYISLSEATIKYRSK